MLLQLPARLESGRITAGEYGTELGSGPNGFFRVNGPCGMQLTIVASDVGGWEHVSVSTRSRCPNWTEMCFIKDLFWDEEELVMQLHPPKSRWISNHPYCLHMWRPATSVIPMPPDIFVGVKAAGENLTPQQARAAHAEVKRQRFL